MENTVVLVRDPNGVYHTIPAEYKDQAIAQGWTIAPGQSEFPDQASAEAQVARLRENDIAQQSQSQGQAVQEGNRRQALSQEAFPNQPNTGRQNPRDARTSDQPPSVSPSMGASRGYEDLDPTMVPSTPAAPGGRPSISPGAAGTPGDLPTGSQNMLRTGDYGGTDPGVADVFGQSQWDPFAGTWAENENINGVDLMLQSGQMTPQYATHRVLDSQGLGSHAQQGALAERYNAFPAYYNMMNPGGRSLMPLEEYAQGGEYVNQMMQPSTGNAIFDPSQMWDNQFSSANDDKYGASRATSATPGQDEYGMISSNIEALVPIVGGDNAQSLMNQTDQLYVMYQDQLLSGVLPPDYSFVQFMRDNGAGDWL